MRRAALVLTALLAAACSHFDLPHIDDGHVCAGGDHPCPPGQGCVTSSNVCRVACGTGGTCPSNETCFPDGYCRDANTLADAAAPLGIAVDSTNAYWVNASMDPTQCTVMEVPLGGGTPVTLASGQNIPYSFPSIAVAGGYVYWGTANGVMRASTGGGPATMAAGCPCSGGEVALTASATNLYWTLDGSDISTMPLGGGSPASFAAGRSVSSLAVGPDNLYWTEDPGVGSPGAVVAAPLGGGTPTTVASGQPNPDSVVVGPTAVYWRIVYASGPGNAVVDVPLGGGAIETLATAQGGSDGDHIAVDSSAVYWAVGDGAGDLLRVPLDGSAVTTLATDLRYRVDTGNNQNYGYLAVDATSVYWTTLGAIGKVAKQ